MNEIIEKQKIQMRDFLCFAFGASIVLLLTSLDQGSFWYAEGGHSGNMLSISAWFAPWLVLQAASLYILFRLFKQKEWKKVAFDSKADLCFGYLTVCWLCAAAFVLRVSDLLNYSHFLLAVLGAALAGSYWVYRHPRNRQEDMFP